MLKKNNIINFYYKSIIYIRLLLGRCQLTYHSVDIIKHSNIGLSFSKLVVLVIYIRVFGYFWSSESTFWLVCVDLYSFWNSCCIELRVYGRAITPNFLLEDGRRLLSYTPEAGEVSSIFFGFQ